MFQSLDKVVRIDNSFRNRTQHVGISLDLRIEIAGDIGEMVQCRGQQDQIGIHVIHDGLSAVGTEHPDA